MERADSARADRARREWTAARDAIAAKAARAWTAARDATADPADRAATAASVRADRVAADVLAAAVDLQSDSHD